jgi:hypothetical protein
MTPDDDLAADRDNAFSEGWHLGKTGRQLVDDDLLPWPVPLRRPFIDGYRAAKETPLTEDE